MVVGRVVGVFGIKGWVKVFSHTQPRENILRYDPWWLAEGDGWRRVALAGGQRHGKGLIAQVAGVADRDAAQALVGRDIAIDRAQLPALPEGEYYWSDLIGLQVYGTGGVPLGRVKELIETGAHDVLVVQGERERLIPWAVPQIVKAVDLAAGRIDVDWAPDY